MIGTVNVFSTKIKLLAAVASTIILVLFFKFRIFSTDNDTFEKKISMVDSTKSRVIPRKLVFNTKLKNKTSVIKNTPSLKSKSHAVKFASNQRSALDHLHFDKNKSIEYWSQQEIENIIDQIINLKNEISFQKVGEDELLYEEQYKEKDLMIFRSWSKLGHPRNIAFRWNAANAVMWDYLKTGGLHQSIAIQGKLIEKVWDADGHLIKHEVTQVIQGKIVVEDMLSGIYNEI